MADVLAALEALEKEQGNPNKKHTATATTKPKRIGSLSSRRNTKTPVAQNNRTKSLPPPPRKIAHKLTPIPTRRISPPGSASRSPSVSSRRISFAEPRRPPARKFFIYTKSSFLGTGFPFDPRLQKYGVSEAEWLDFSAQVIEAAPLKGKKWTWLLNRSDVIRQVKRELQYEGDFRRILRRWNKHFRRKGFTAFLELPWEKGDPARSASVEPKDGDSSDSDSRAGDSLQVPEKKFPKRFRMVISSSQERGSSVYSRSSSLTRTVTGEGQRAREERERRSDDDDEDADGEANEHAVTKEPKEEEVK